MNKILSSLKGTVLQMLTLSDFSSGVWRPPSFTTDELRSLLSSLGDKSWCHQEIAGTVTQMSMLDLLMLHKSIE